MSNMSHAPTLCVAASGSLRQDNTKIGLLHVGKKKKNRTRNEIDVEIKQIKAWDFPYQNNWWI